MEHEELPLGLGFVLAQDPEAMQSFSNLPAERRAELIRRARSVTSKTEMQSLVSEVSFLKKA